MDDAAAEGNGFAREPIGVATAIPAFVLRPDDGADRFQGRDPRQDSFGDDWMLVHQRQLLAGQWSRFVEQLNGQPDLSDVVKQRGILELSEWETLEAKTLRDSDREHGRSTRV